MLARCITAVNAAAGRTLSAAELAKIERAVENAGTRLARADRERWTSLTAEERTAEVGAQAVKDLQAEAQLGKYRSLLQTLERSRDQAPAEASALVRQTVAALREFVDGRGAPPAVAKAAPAEALSPYETAVYEHMRQLAIDSPDMPVMLEGGEKMTAREAQALIEREFAHESSDASLAQTAAECYLRSGGMPAAAAGTSVAPSAAALRAAARAATARKIGENVLVGAATVIGIL